MKITLLVVGKTNDPHFIAGIEEYAKRIRHYLPFDIEVIPELRNTKSLSEEQQKEKEADLLLKAFQPGDHIVLLGRTRTGTSFGGVSRMDGKADGSRTETDGVRRGRSLRFLTAHLRKGKRESLAFAHDILASNDPSDFHRTNLSGHDHHQRRTLSS